MINVMTQEEIEVINEFIEFAKNKTGIITAEMLWKRLQYDFIYGKGQSIELLNKHFYEIMSDNHLLDYQIKRLAKEIVHREYRWIAGNNFEFNFDDVIYDGYGYVVISDGTRIDIDTQSYKEERDAFNKVQAERLSNHPTNGKEYLDI
jgi:hypothetical protein